MQAHVDCSNNFQVIKKERPVGSMFPDYLSASYDSDFTGGLKMK